VNIYILVEEFQGLLIAPLLGAGMQMQPLPKDAWDAWSPQELAEQLRGTSSSWHVVGGWALDLWHGSQSRKHEDLEFAVLPEDVDQFRILLAGLDFFSAKDGTLHYFPSSASLPRDVTQLWGADMRQGCWRVDMMVERGTTDLWVYKRDPTIQMRRAKRYAEVLQCIS
jgi:hypothetical protein